MHAPSFFRGRVAVAPTVLGVVSVLSTAVLPCAAATLRVPSEYPSIQAALNACAVGDTVLVAPGTYAGPDNRDLSFGGTDLVLRSSGGLAVTIIDCQTQGRGLVFQNGETAASVVEGFTIQNGLAGGTYGGAILIEGGATPTLQDCRFLSNHANSGGAIYVVSSGATLSDCEFENNTADNFGGGLYGSSARLELAGCSFSTNGAAFGAGIYVHSASTAVLSDCTFSENTALNLAGGICGSRSDFTLERCTFVRHTGAVGAAVYLEAGTAIADSCTFSNNSAEAAGGGVYAADVGPLTITRCSFERNTALGALGGQLPRGGGGLRAYDVTGSSILVADCKFDENQALGGGNGGGYLGGGPTTVIERCTFTNNYADDGGGHSGSALRRECTFEGNTAVAVGGGTNGGGELIDCRLIGNHSGGYGGGGAVSASTIVRCEFSGNSSDVAGGAYYYAAPAPLTVEDSRFSDNHSPSGGGLRIYAYSEPVSITGCAFERNTGFHEGGAAVVLGPAEDPPPVTISSCTLVGNTSPLGASGFLLGIPVEIENTIIAFATEGEAVTCSDMGVGVISCTDIYGNAGGDWIGCISDQLGINGNFSADPVFCNVGSGDYTLAETSPCAPEHSPAECGLIGAFPVACVNPIGIAEEPAPPVAGGLRVIPNPVRSGATFTFDDGIESPALEIYDPNGRLIDFLRPTGHSAAWLPGSDARSGVYFARLRGAGGARVVKFLVLR